MEPLVDGFQSSQTPEEGLLGSAEDGISDSFSQVDMEARVLSCYAGGHAQRRADQSTGTDGCDTDEVIAAGLLREWAWESRERELRDKSEQLVALHWSEIEAVADELLRQRLLDETEVEIIADTVAGLDDCSETTLEMYRLAKKGSPE